MTTKSSLVKDCLKYFSPAIIMDILCLYTENYVQIFIAKYIGTASDHILKGKFETLKQSVYLIVIALIVGIVLVPIFNYLRNKAMLVFGARYDIYVYHHFLEQEYSILDRFDSGELLSRVEMDPISFRISLMDLLSEIVLGIVLLVQALIILSAIHPMYTLITFLFSIPSIILPMLLKKIIKKTTVEIRNEENRVVDQEKRMIENLLFIQFNGIYEKASSFLSRAYKKYLESFGRNTKVKTLADAMSAYISMICRLAIYATGSIFISNGSLSIGKFVQFVLTAEVLKEAIRHLERLTRMYSECRVSTDRIFETIGHPEQAGGVKLESFEQIKIEGLCFGYTDKKILDNLNIEIHKGQTTAIAGSNGSGKTTLIKLLTGLYNNYDGNIWINDIELKKIDVFSLRKLITYVTQKPLIFDTTVYENVKMVREDAAAGEIDEVLKLMELQDIRSAEAGESGKHLSGGEKQAISIARAILRDTPVIVLDEPTNALDKSKQEFIRGYLHRKNKTIIVITHDQELLNNMDKVINLACW